VVLNKLKNFTNKSLFRWVCYNSWIVCLSLGNKHSTKCCFVEDTTKNCLFENQTAQTQLMNYSVVGITAKIE